MSTQIETFFVKLLTDVSTLSLMSSQDHCQEVSQLETLTSQAGFAHACDTNSGSVEWNCALVRGIPLWCLIRSNKTLSTVIQQW